MVGEVVGDPVGRVEPARLTSVGRRARPTEAPPPPWRRHRAPRGGIRRRSSSFFFRHPKTQRGLTLCRAVVVDARRLSRVARLLLLANAFWRVDSLTSSRGPRLGVAQLRHRLLRELAHGVPREDVLPDLAPHGGHGGVRHDRRSRLRLPDRLLRGAGGVAARAIGDHDRGRDPAVGELPCPGLRVEGDARGRRPGRGVPSMRSDSPTCRSPGRTFAMWLTFCYLWLPFAILPIYASLERVPDSLHRGIGGSRGAHRQRRSGAWSSRWRCRGSSPARSSRSRSRSATTSFPGSSARAVPRQRDPRAVREQPAARGNDRVAAR